MSKSRIPVRKKVILCLVIKDLVFVRTFCSKNWRIGGFLKCLLIVKRRVDQAKAPSLPQTSKMEHVTVVVNGFQSFTITAKLSISDICVGLG